MSGRFQPGQRVRVIDLGLAGHVRTPFYVRKHIGRVERYCGAYANPERRAYGDPSPPRINLYRIRFLQRDLWPDYAGRPDDTVEIEIYEHWLEPADTDI
ncbi:SH3-like domain-containing protein [Lacisediminimonas sp.]|uniref:SH3-like domain-containing protein n=1 Tax=Lacisediminimonas sp. TaxID=3060582 RepID=UPI002726EDE4|nr:nitrile hydratase subunit beta [Lacisediminimonas sp.]